MDNETPKSGLRVEKLQHQSRQAQAVVRCKGFRCAAYLDEKGVWRSVADHGELEVLEVLIRFDLPRVS